MFLKKIMKQDENYTMPFPTDIPKPNLVVIGTPGSGKCRMPLRINREIYCDQLDARAKILTTYNGLSETELILAAKNIFQLMNERYNECEYLVATPDFLLLLDAVNGLARTGECPSKEFQQKYVGILQEMLNDITKEKSLKEKNEKNTDKID